MTADPLTTRQAAECAGLTPRTWATYVSRGVAPRPDGQHDGRTPTWDRALVEAWKADREATKTHQREAAAEVGERS